MNYNTAVDWRVFDHYSDTTNKVLLIEREDTGGNKSIQFENNKYINITIELKEV